MDFGEDVNSIDDDQLRSLQKIPQEGREKSQAKLRGLHSTECRSETTQSSKRTVNRTEQPTVR